jgi:hypothetical protein
MCDERSVLLHVRCGGCMKMYQRMAVLPEGMGTPIDGDELMENPLVREMRFQCPKCEAPFAEVVAFKIIERPRAA